jgi:uncharacterized protein (DUF58 family)
MTTLTEAAPAAASARTPRERFDVFAGLQRRLGLTALGLGMLAVILIVITLGRALPSRGMTMLGYGLVLVLAISWVLARRNLPIDARRSDLPSRVPARRTVDAEITLVGKRRISAIVVEEEIDKHLGAPIRVGVPVLPTGREITHSYSFTPTVRGIFTVGPLIAEFSDPFGLTRRRQQITKPTKIIVHPRVEPVVDRITSREWEDPPIRPPFSRPWPSGFEFYGMREYVHGDDPRITVAASLAAKHLSDGFSVSLDTNETRLFRAYRGAGKRIPMLDTLAAVRPGATPLTSSLERMLVDPQRNAHNIVITPELSQAAATRLRLLLERGTSMVVVLVVWDDTDPMTLHRAGGLRCNVVEVSPGTPLGSVFALAAQGGRR